MKKIFPKLVVFICRQSFKHPLLFLMIGIIISIPAIRQFNRVGLDTDLIRLLPDSSESVTLKKKIEPIVGGSGGFFAILLESQDSHKLMTAFREIRCQIKENENFRSLEYKNPLKFYKKYQLLLLSEDYLNRILEFFIRLESRVNPLTEDLLAEESEIEDEQEKKDIKRFLRYLDLSEYHQSPDGQVMALKLYPHEGITSLGKLKKIFDQLENTTGKIAEKYGVFGGVSGSLRSSLEQYDFVITDLTKSGTITILAVFFTLIIGFVSIKIIPVVLFPLILGLIWTFGSIPVLTGDLNTISSFLLLVSFGLGIDFSIHLALRFIKELANNNPYQALEKTFLTTGRSIVISGLTTAFALFILTFSRFSGFSEFGIVGGYSLIMILVAMIIFLPSVLVIGLKIGLLTARKKYFTLRPLSSYGVYVFIFLIIVSLALGIYGLKFDYDFSKMDIEIPQHKDLKDRFYRVYETVRSPAALFVAKDIETLTQLIKLLSSQKNQKYDSRISHFFSIRNFSPDTSEFNNKLLLVREIKEIVKKKWLKRVEDPDYKKWIFHIRNWTPPNKAAGFEELPGQIKNSFISEDFKDHFIISVYIKGDKQKGKNAIAFSKELKKINPSSKIIGPFGETTVLSEVLQIVISEGPWLVLITFLGIFVIIMINQRSFKETLLILSPLISGMVLLTGIMVVIGIKLNFFNMVVFPTLIGMGVDDGVHYFRRFKENGRNIKKTQAELFNPLSLTTITTICGYIGITFSHHPGLQAIGILACIGLICIWFTTIFLLPGILKLFLLKDSVSS